jgi:hypothetical protein
MSIGYWLVAATTKQFVNVAICSASYVRGPDDANVLGLFCSVHEHKGAVLMSDHDLDESGVNRGTYDLWTTESAVGLFTAVTGSAPSDEVVKSLQD